MTAVFAVFPLLVVCCLFRNAFGNALQYDDPTQQRFTIEGTAHSNDLNPYHMQWSRDVWVNINDGAYKGFVRENGSFIVSLVPYGSYVLEIIHPEVIFEPIRLEINPKGKFRTRKINYVQPSQIIQIPYPLRIKAFRTHNYFQMREQWKITDFLFSPMVLMMLLPLLLLLVLPKLMSDPETKKEMEQLNLSKMTSDMPEMSEMITSFFSPSKDTKTKVLSKPNKKKH